MNRIYLDHAATTPLDPRVLEVMLPYLRDHYGNASSVHALGRKARYAVEECRERISAHLEVAPGDIIFTSGGTEANNLAIKGVLGDNGGGLLTSSAEHEAVLTQAKSRMTSGESVCLLTPESNGGISLSQLEAALTQDVHLVSLMHANNEVGTLNPVAEIAKMCNARGILYHCDAVQTSGQGDVWPAKLGVDMMSASSHKFYGPKGVGWLYVRPGIALTGVIEGGSQERRRRGGTENVPAIVGMAKAFDLAIEEQEIRRAHLLMLRRRLIEGLEAIMDDCFYVLNTPERAEICAPHIVNIAFPPVNGETIDGEMLILNMDMQGICVASGSACTSGAIEPSHVLLAMGLDQATASAAVRFSLGKDNTPEEVDRAVDSLHTIIKRMRKSSVA